MNDELIRKSEVIDAIKRVLGGYCMGSAVASAINKIQPVNAVELPCKIGNNLYEICNNEIHEQTVEGISISKNAALINCESKNFYWCEIGDNVFLTREEAEKALEEMKNE